MLTKSRESMMDEMMDSAKTGANILLAISMSIVVHCCIAALLLTCFKGMMQTPVSPDIISVDIRALETPEVKRKPASGPAQHAPHRELTVKPARLEKRLQEQVRKPLPVTRTEPLQVPSLTGPAETTQNTLPDRTGMSSPAKERVLPPGDGITAVPPASDKPVPGGLPGIAEIRQDSAYLATLRAIIEREKDYPAMARRGRMEGTVRVSCILARNGRITETRVVRSSGHGILDNAAIRSVNAVGGFPCVPSEIKGDSFKFIVPITYRLED